jgi:hypothetical protein
MAAKPNELNEWEFDIPRDNRFQEWPIQSKPSSTQDQSRISSESEETDENSK